MTTLLDLCELIVDCEHKTAPTVEEGYPSIRTPNVGRGRLILDSVNRVDDETYKQWTRRAVPQYRDLIIAREAPVGNVAIIGKGQKVCLGQRTVLVRPDPQKVNPEFLCYFMLGKYVQDRFFSTATGATVPHLNMRDIRGLKMSGLPSLPTQHRIASILSAYDDLIENNTRRIAILEEMARRLYKEWFVKFCFPGHEEVSFKETELGKIPAEWELKPLCEVAEVTYGHPFKAKQFNEKGEGLGAVRIRDVLGGEIKTYTTEEGKPKHLISNGDILVGMDGHFHMGKWTGGEAWLVQRVARFRPLKPMGRYLLFLSIEGPIKYLEETIVGTTVAHLSARDLKEMHVLLPAERVLDVAAKVLEPMYELEIGLRKKNANLRTQRDLLLPKLVSGQIDVSEIELPDAEEQAA